MNLEKMKEQFLIMIYLNMKSLSLNCRNKKSLTQFRRKQKKKKKMLFVKCLILLGSTPSIKNLRIPSN